MRKIRRASAGCHAQCSRMCEQRLLIAFLKTWLGVGLLRRRNIEQSVQSKLSARDVFGRWSVGGRSRSPRMRKDFLDELIEQFFQSVVSVQENAAVGLNFIPNIHPNKLLVVIGDRNSRGLENGEKEKTVLTTSVMWESPTLQSERTLSLSLSLSSLSLSLSSSTIDKVLTLDRSRRIAIIGSAEALPILCVRCIR